MMLMYTMSEDALEWLNLRLINRPKKVAIALVGKAFQAEMDYLSTGQKCAIGPNIIVEWEELDYSRLLSSRPGPLPTKLVTEMIPFNYSKNGKEQ
jgi:hypothetical protein